MKGLLLIAGGVVLYIYLNDQGYIGNANADPSVGSSGGSKWGALLLRIQPKVSPHAPCSWCPGGSTGVMK